MEDYPGHGTGATSWVPVMGGPTGKNVTQWSRGDYNNGTNDTSIFGLFGLPPQDDIAIIAGKLGFRADDYGILRGPLLPRHCPPPGHSVDVGRRCVRTAARQRCTNRNHPVSCR